MSRYPARMPCFEVFLEETGERFAARDNESVLEAAQRAGITLASSCRNGTCRTCMRRLLAGEVAYRVDWPGLTREERAEGWFLPCVAVPHSALRVGEPARPAWWE